ncbi:MAG: hypothetical protein AAF311_15640 [Pseudomonadota bacterium]
MPDADPAELLRSYAFEVGRLSAWDTDAHLDATADLKRRMIADAKRIATKPTTQPIAVSRGKGQAVRFRGGRRLNAT